MMAGGTFLTSKARQARRKAELRAPDEAQQQQEIEEILREVQEAIPAEDRREIINHLYFQMPFQIRAEPGARLIFVVLALAIADLGIGDDDFVVQRSCKVSDGKIVVRPFLGNAVAINPHVSAERYFVSGLFAAHCKLLKLSVEAVKWAVIGTGHNPWEW